jgi:predicted MFS family arabinose efflux permease
MPPHRSDPRHQGRSRLSSFFASAPVASSPAPAPMPASESARAGEWRRGWPLVLAAMLGAGFGPGLFQNLSSLFLPGLEHDFGWSRGGIATMTAVALGGGIVAPFVGRLADRHGARPVIVASMLLLAAAHIGLALAAPVKWQFQALLVLLVLTMPGTSTLVYGKLIARAFVHHRGAALAVATSGLAVATLFMPPVVGAAIGALGWRWGFVVLALGSGALALPLILIAIRRVEDLPADAGRAHVAGPTPIAGITAAEARRDSRFWRMILGAMCINFATVGLVTQLVPLGTERGIGAADAALLLTAFGTSQLAGRFLIGFAVDRFRPQRVATLVALTSAAAFVAMAAAAPGLVGMLVLVFLAGLMNGAENDLLPFLLARLFGLRAFAEIYGSGIPFGLVGAGLGILTFGRSHDWQGDYWPALLLGAVALMVAAWCFHTLADRLLPEVQTAAMPVAEAEGAH